MAEHPSSTVVNQDAHEKPATLLPAEQCLPGRADPIADVPPADAKHLVLGTALYPPWPERAEVAYFGLGCVWCSEAVLLGKAPAGSLYSTQCGYANGVTPNPTNTEVHTGRTNHVEVVRTVFYPELVSFSTLCRLFFESHDPTTPNRQGPDDIGTEYRSAILCTTEDQLQIACDIAHKAECLLKDKGLRSDAVVTDIAKCQTFYYAEIEHQQHDWRPNTRAGCGLVPTGLKFPKEQLACNNCETNKTQNTEVETV